MPEISRRVDSIEQITPAAGDGSIKASILIRQMTLTSSILTIAFRGTVSLMYWVIILDGDLEDATTFLSSNPALYVESAHSSSSSSAHKGLLRVATAMAPTVCDKILKSIAAISTTSKRPVLLITGHSAGCGVAGFFSAHLRASGETS